MPSAEVQAGKAGSKGREGHGRKPSLPHSEKTMLLLARKSGQSVVIDGNIRVTVDRIRGRVVRLKVEAPRKIRVDREEVWIRRASDNQHVLSRGG